VSAHSHRGTKPREEAEEEEEEEEEGEEEERTPRDARTAERACECALSVSGEEFGFCGESESVSVLSLTNTPCISLHLLPTCLYHHQYSSPSQPIPPA
jgi:hypothetical protein